MATNQTNDIFQFESPFNPEQAIERLKQFKEHRLDYVYFEHSKDEISFVIHVKHSEFIVLTSKIYLTPKRQDNSEVTTTVTLKLLNESYLETSDSPIFDFGKRGTRIFVVVMGLITILILQSLGIDMLPFLADMPVIKYNALIFQILCLGSIGVIVTIPLTIIYREIVKPRGAFSSPYTKWHELKNFIQNVLIDTSQ